MFAEIVAFLNTAPGKAAATGILLAMVSVGTGGYILGKDVGEKQLQVYQAANAIDFKSVAREAVEATLALQLAAKEIGVLSDARKRITELQGRYDQLEAEAKRAIAERDSNQRQLDERDNELRAVKAELATYADPETRAAIQEHTSRVLAQGLVRIGLVSASSISTIVVNGPTHRVTVGSIIVAENTRDKKCTIAVEKTTVREIIVDVQCK
jgi:hypothetical protein